MTKEHAVDSDKGNAEQAFRDTLAAVLAREVAPRCAAIERDDDWSASRAAVRALGEAGLLGALFPKHAPQRPALVGLGAAALVSEQLAYLNYGLESGVATTLSAAFAIDRFADDALRQRYLPELIGGRMFGAICFTEREVGTDAAGMSTGLSYDAQRDEWVINGFKRYISNAGVAGVYVVWGRSRDDLASQQGMSTLLVPADTPGLTVQRRYHFMGRRGCVVGEVEFVDCRVPASHLLGARDGGFKVMLAAFNFERILVGAAGLGVARSAFDIACRHVQTREVFGEKLGCKQLAWERIAQMSWRIEATRLLVHDAARQYDGGVAARQLMKPASMAKLVGSETANYCADATVQLLGGDGLTQEYGRAEQIYRDARALPIVGGTNEIAKYLIACSDLPEIKPSL
jgi:alkylation response protein AidB-like acyl-CoA dehydrogenase